MSDNTRPMGYFEAGNILRAEIPEREVRRTSAKIGRGKLRISYEKIKHILGIPNDVNIVKVESHQPTNTVNIVIESPNLKKIEEGATIPFVTLQQLSGFDE